MANTSTLSGGYMIATCFCSYVPFFVNRFLCDSVGQINMAHCSVATYFIMLIEVWPSTFLIIFFLQAAGLLLLIF